MVVGEKKAAVDGNFLPRKAAVDLPVKEMQQFRRKFRVLVLAFFSPDIPCALVPLRTPDIPCAVVPLRMPALHSFALVPLRTPDIPCAQVVCKTHRIFHKRPLQKNCCRKIVMHSA